MSESLSNPEDRERISAWVDRVEREWRELGVAGRERRVLAADLQRDLDDSVAVGADIGELLHSDVGGFARDLAEASGVALTPQRIRVEPSTANLIMTVLAGGVAGALVAWFVVYPVGLSALSQASDVAATFLLHGTAALITIACALVAVRWRFRDDPRVTLVVVARAGIGFTLGGLLAILPTVLFAETTGYSSAPPVILVEATIVAAFCTVGIIAALRLRPETGTREPSTQT